MLFGSLVSEAREWCTGRNWLWRLPILVWFGYIFVRHMFDSAYGSILGWLNLGIHELGHVIMGPFGLFWSVPAGTLAQLGACIFGMFNFYRQEDYFSIALCFGWLATSFFDVARYSGDARSMVLPLVSLFGSENTYHDWNYMLSGLNLLQFDTVIALFMKACAGISMCVCLVAGSWMLWQMMIPHAVTEQS
jgi:hypothetical protein